MLRILAGRFKGRVIRAPHGEQTRPTQARLRTALFDALQGVIAEARVLDLFAGSGALAFEALSRGAKHATLVEMAQPATRCLRQNIAELAVEDQCFVVAGDLREKRIQQLITRQGPFGVIFVDPPYVKNATLDWSHWVLDHLPWENWLESGALLSMESSSRGAPLPDLSGTLVKVRGRIYGDSLLTFYERKLRGKLNDK